MGRGRPGLPVGTYGDISITQHGDAIYRARTRFRDRDGVVRQVLRTGQTKKEAERNLKVALTERATAAHHDGVTAASTVAALSRYWLDDVRRSDKAPNTLEAYEGAVRRYVIPAMGGLRLSEVVTATCARVIGDVATQRGPSAAKACRAALMGMFGYAARLGAVTANPVRDSGSIPRSRKPARALTAAEQERLSDRLRTDARAVRWDLPDLVDFMLGTGCRVGEACAVRDAVLDLDRGGTVEINATVVRVRGAGLVVQERPKTAAGWRVLALPPDLVAMLRRRDTELHLRAPGGIVFGSPLQRGLRDSSNTAADLRAVLDAWDCEHCDGSGFKLDDAGVQVLSEHGRPVRCDLGPWSWVTSHTFRKTVATRLDDAGWSARQIADQLGHAQPSMTQDVYMGRKVVAASAASALAR